MSQAGRSTAIFSSPKEYGCVVSGLAVRPPPGEPLGVDGEILDDGEQGERQAPLQRHPILVHHLRGPAPFKSANEVSVCFTVR